MLTREENETLTRVGRGTPVANYYGATGGRGAAGELTDEKPIKAVKLLGEELVVIETKGATV
jgi:hypothetical protein